MYLLKSASRFFHIICGLLIAGSKYVQLTPVAVEKTVHLNTVTIILNLIEILLGAL